MDRPLKQCFWIGTVVFFLTGGVATSSETGGREVEARTEYPVIVRLVTRSHTITVSAGPEPLYSVSSADGSALCRELTIEQLKTSRPALYEQIKPAVAPSADAGVLTATVE